MDPQKVPDHHTDPVTPPVLSHLRPEQALQHRTPPVALQPLSSLLVVVLLEELVGAKVVAYVDSIVSVTDAVEV